MRGAILGDYFGSVYEFDNCKDYDKVQLIRRGREITDDSLMTIAVAEALLKSNLNDIDDDEIKRNCIESMQAIGRKYPMPMGGFGTHFSWWLEEDNPLPYCSWGNGSAMRVSPVGWAFDDLKTTLHVAKLTAEISHDHPDGIRGAQVTAGCIYLYRHGKSDRDVAEFTESFGYDVSKSIDEIRPDYEWEASCE